MTTTTEQTTGEATTDQQTATNRTATVDQIVYRDPNTLAAHPSNVRTHIGNVDGIAKTITQVGILEPIILVPTEDGGEVILAGHRRVAAAIQAGETSVPCILRPDLASDIDALTSMLVENIHRANLTDVEKAHAYEQLSGFGLSAPQIAKRTGVKQKTVKESLTVASSDLALAAGERYHFLTLEHLVSLAEFENDKEAVKELTVIAKEDPDYFADRASQLRIERERKVRFDQVVVALTEAGVTVIDDPGWSHSRPVERLSRLSTAKGKPITAAAHVHCAGHAASISEYDPERVTYWCTDPDAYGHVNIRTATSTSTVQEVDGELVEQRRAERRKVIDHNKAMAAAIPVRRTFVQSLIARKSAPKGLLRYLVTELAIHPQDMTNRSDALLAELCDIAGDADGPSSVGGQKAVTEATDAQLANVLLGLVASSIESTWDKTTWRYCDARQIAYLNFLIEQGYRPAEVEQEMVDSATEQVTAEGAAEDTEQQQEADE